MDDQSDALIRKLVRQLHDADPLARRNAAGALRLHGERAASTISELRELLTDKDTRVRAEARRAVNRLRQPAA